MDKKDGLFNAENENIESVEEYDPEKLRAVYGIGRRHAEEHMEEIRTFMEK